MSLTRQLVVAALVIGCPLCARAAPELRTQGGRFVDTQGRVVLLRGINVAGNSKVPDFRPVKQASFFDPLSQLGMNAIRLLFNWEAYEMQLGVYDDSYLAYYATAADWAWQHGLYVMVDFHQDAFSRFALAGCGEGFPAWALPPGLTPAVPDNS